MIKLQIPKHLKSVRMKLFLTLTVAVIIIIVFLILLNNVVLEAYYLHSKRNSLLEVYHNLNNYYNNLEVNKNVDLELELDKVALNNNFDMIIKTEDGLNVFSSNKNFLDTIGQISETEEAGAYASKKDTLYEDNKLYIKKVRDKKTASNVILLSATLDNGYKLYIRLPIASIQESVKISNNFLLLIGSVTIIIGGMVVSVISNRFTKPISELDNIARRMANLDFSRKYEEKNSDDEINNLGKSINILSDKLEKTINQLKEANIELEKDIEHKSKIDEMRKQFISDVSHELKTPIALIQGYAEGLQENVTSDEESRKFYVEVILDEANKMDKLVKQLLELMKLEYGKREFNNIKFDMKELIREVIRKTSVMLEEKNITVKFEAKEPVYVYADEFYIEQVITNYLTNAIKHVEERNKEKLIEIRIEEKKDGKARIYVYNTGEPLSEENQNRIWNRFYKVDSSRNREKGGTGIGLSLVKAIMNNYKNSYGVYNRENGVEFYFDLDCFEKEEKGENIN